MKMRVEVSAIGRLVYGRGMQDSGVKRMGE